MKLIDSIVTQAAGIAAVRREIHAHPELCFQEVRTADLVAAKLTEWGIPIHRGLGTTGVVGIVKNGTSSRAVGLRADMDALPIHEATGATYSSQHQGCMHACGHDGHTTMLLGAARYLAATRQFDGTLTLIFQPAEEGQGGAEAMLAEARRKQIYDRLHKAGYPTRFTVFETGSHGTPVRMTHHDDTVGIAALRQLAAEDVAGRLNVIVIDQPSAIIASIFATIAASNPRAQPPFRLQHFPALFDTRLRLSRIG